MAEFRLGVLASGGGTTFEAVQEAINAGSLLDTSIEFVVSNRSEGNAGVWERAQRLGVPILHVSNVTEEQATGKCTIPKIVDDLGKEVPAKGTISMEVSQKLLQLADDRGIHMYVGLGYLKRLVGPVLREIPIANSHPGPLPATAGEHSEHVQEKVMELGLDYSGPTFHWMNKDRGAYGLPDYDSGTIIGHEPVRVTDNMRNEWLNDRTVKLLQSVVMIQEKRMIVAEWIPEAEKQLVV